jgi:hypothetical protein
MELALATTQVKARSGLTEASRLVVLMIAFGYGIAYLVPACISFASQEVNDEASHSTAFDHGSGFNLHAELICGSAAPRLRERSECTLPK